MVAVLRRAGAIGVVAGLMLGLAAIVSSPAPAGADVTGISPSSRDVNVGDSAAATVSVSDPTCITGTPSDPDVQVGFSPTCSGDSSWRSTMVVRPPDAPGTYSVTVRDDKFGGGEATSPVGVHERPPPPTTTTTAPPPPPT